MCNGRLISGLKDEGDKIGKGTSANDSYANEDDYYIHVGLVEEFVENPKWISQ